jgi:hypothetical protein
MDALNKISRLFLERLFPLTFPSMACCVLTSDDDDLFPFHRLVIYSAYILEFYLEQTRKPFVCSFVQ